MSFRSTRRAGLIAATAGLLGGTLFAGTSQASPPDPATLATKLAHQLGARSAGSYLDRSTHKLVVTTTTAADTQKVRAAGAVARQVARSGAQLQQVTAALTRTARVPGTAWAVDPATDQVVLSIDSSVTGSRLARVQRAARTLGSAVRTERVAGTFKPFIAGGDAIYSGQYRCSLGFNVRSGSTYYFLTAGHCGNIGSSWYSDAGHSNLIGTRRASSFPGNDYSIITYASGVSHPGTVDLYNGSSQDITGAGNAVVGESVRRSGSTTHVHSGQVTALNQTVNYEEGTVSGLIRTNVCAEGGDSGGPLFDGGTALGLTSGGSGDCTFGGTTFFQPVTEALNAYGVSVY